MNEARAELPPSLRSSLVHPCKQAMHHACSHMRARWPMADARRVRLSHVSSGLSHVSVRSRQTPCCPRSRDPSASPSDAGASPGLHCRFSMRDDCNYAYIARSRQPPRARARASPCSLTHLKRPRPYKPCTAACPGLRGAFTCRGTPSSTPCDCTPSSRMGMTSAAPAPPAPTSRRRWPPRRQARSGR